MDSNAPDLRNYINQQRASGIGDEAIHASLVASGWQHDIVVRALSSSAENPSERGQSNSSGLVSATGNEKYIKKVKVIGVIAIIFGVLTILESFRIGFSQLQLVFGVAEVAIGYGLLSFNRFAYTFFNLMAILAILSGILVLFGFAIVMALLAQGFSLDVFFTAIAMLVSVGKIGFYIYGGFVLHKKEIRLLFASK